MMVMDKNFIIRAKILDTNDSVGSAGSSVGDMF